MGQQKTLNYYLVIDWKNEKVKARKTKPDSLRAYEIMGELEIDITIPKVDVPDLALEVEVPEPQLHEAVVRAIDDEDLPDWSNIASTIINRNVDDIDEVTDETVDVLTTKTLLEASGRPDVREVRAYIQRMLDQVVEA